MPSEMKFSRDEIRDAILRAEVRMLCALFGLPNESPAFDSDPLDAEFVIDDILDAEEIG